VGPSEIRWIERHINTTDWFLDDILLKNADLKLSEQELEKAYSQHLNFLKTARKNHLASKVEAERFVQMMMEAGMNLGSLQSTSEKSKP
jgi:hypothetical protein